MSYDMSQCVKVRNYPRTVSRKKLREMLEEFTHPLTIIGKVNLKGDGGMASAFIGRADGGSLCHDGKVAEEFRVWWQRGSLQHFGSRGSVVPAVNPNARKDGGERWRFWPRDDRRNNSRMVLVLAFKLSGAPAPPSEGLVDKVLEAVRCVTGVADIITGMMQKVPNTKKNSGGEVYVEMPSVAEAQHLVDNELLDAYRVDVNGVTYYLHAVQTQTKNKMYSIQQKGVFVRPPVCRVPLLPARHRPQEDMRCVPPPAQVPRHQNDASPLILPVGTYLREDCAAWSASTYDSGNEEVHAPGSWSSSSSGTPLSPWQHQPYSSS